MRSGEGPSLRVNDVCHRTKKQNRFLSRRTLSTLDTWPIPHRTSGCSSLHLLASTSQHQASARRYSAVHPPATSHKSLFTSAAASFRGQGRDSENKVDFVDGEQYLFFAGVSRGWKLSWGKRATRTHAVTAHTTVPQLRQSFECG